jgi:glycosyltransferase involved in cell wall biosynthesis
MNTTHKFSVIIPLYNKEREISRAVQSVLAQTIEAFELIVIDDGSTDTSAGKVREFNDTRIRLITQENLGVSAARNRGLREAASEMISFLDADDEWSREYLETIDRLTHKFPNAGLYVTAYERKTPKGHIVKAKIPGIPAPPWEGIIPQYFKSAYLGDPPVCTSTATVPKRVIEKVGYFKVGEQRGEDLDMWGRIAIHYPIAFSWQIGAIYYQNARNRSIDGGHLFSERETPFVSSARKAIENGEVRSSLLRDLREYMARRHIDVAGEYLWRGNNAKVSRRILLKTNPQTPRLLQRKRLLLLCTYFPSRVRSLASEVKSHFRE